VKLPRLPHDPATLIEFFDEGLAALGAVCERSWHDRLDLLAEGRATALWPGAGDWIEKQLRFVPAEATETRDADVEVFPGCPLTFRLAEALRPISLPLERVALQPFDQGRPPSADGVERLWRVQIGPCSHWGLERPFQSSWHFSLVLTVRCEIQAIDQNWSLHRVALTLPGGQPDNDLAQRLDFAQVNPHPDQAIEWPRLNLGACREAIQKALLAELDGDLAGIRARQESCLRRELERIDGYFENYTRELQQRVWRARSKDSHSKMDGRLAAARAEHGCRRHDQIQRHVIRIVPHFDALLLVAEPAWNALVSVVEHGAARRVDAMYLPRARRWIIDHPLSDDHGPS
jgi:hypothetical protein